jgi:hypothetical protein
VRPPQSEADVTRPRVGQRGPQMRRLGHQRSGASGFLNLPARGRPLEAAQLAAVTAGTGAVSSPQAPHQPCHGRAEQAGQGRDGPVERRRSPVQTPCRLGVAQVRQRHQTGQGPVRGYGPAVQDEVPGPAQP